ncbi:glycoside hydrolase family 28 protein [Chitinophaga sp. CB10]|uniref:glycoside hydrolase family 28 protein n=1 Tax=Chitinophaga sp. CB10 TaxID=1891659 RepID=UPI000B0F6211|nr:glycoside hydrolase family 28 protein [Chitinophaga sp. CB10]
MTASNTLRTIGAFFAFFLTMESAYSQKATVWTTTAQPLKEMEQVRRQIKAPVFKQKDYNVTAYGAKGDGTTMNSEAFRKAIEACAANGGGRVIVPAGRFLTGPLYLKSNVNLHLEDNAVIAFSRDSKDYPIVFTRWEGMECMNYSAQIYAYGEKNIAVTGSGILDGNADNDNWWSWCGKPVYGWSKDKPRQQPARDSLHALMHANTDPRKRVFGEGYYLRPNMFQPYNCKNVEISGVQLINSPMWFINPVLCENVIVRGVKVKAHGPNTDGCDPESCKNVLIKDCYFDTGDDCIAIKSGRDEDGRRIGRPAENHIIEGCDMKDGHGGVVIGSEIAGGARNIYAINCKMNSPELDRVLRIKTSSSRGGIIENIFMKDIKVGQYKEAAIHATMFYEKPGNYMPVIRNIWVENLEVTGGGQYGIFVNAYEASPVTNLRIVNSSINGVKVPLKVDHAKGVVFDNLSINGQRMEVPADIK